MRSIIISTKEYDAYVREQKAPKVQSFFDFIEKKYLPKTLTNHAEKISFILERDLLQGDTSMTYVYEVKLITDSVDLDQFFTSIAPFHVHVRKSNKKKTNTDS